MAQNDGDILNALSWALKQYSTRAEVDAYAIAAVANLTAGVQLMNVSFEGGQGSGMINCPTHVVLAACKKFLEDGGFSIQPAEKSVVFQQFSNSVLQT